MAQARMRYGASEKLEIINLVEGFEFKAMAPPANINGDRIEENLRIPMKPDGWAITYSNEHLLGLHPFASVP